MHPLFPGIAASSDSNRFIMTASDDGFNVGYLRGNYGSIIPTDAGPFLTDNINALETFPVGPFTLRVSLLPVSTPDTDIGAFTRVEFTGDFGSGEETFGYNRADRDLYDQGFGAARWEWGTLSANQVFISGNEYRVQFL